MGHIEDLQNKGFGSHGGKQYTVENDIKPLKKRVLMLSVVRCLLQIQQHLVVQRLGHQKFLCH